MMKDARGRGAAGALRCLTARPQRGTIRAMFAVRRVGLAVLLLAVACTGALPGDGDRPPDGGALSVCLAGDCPDATVGPAPFSLVVLPDTQFYAEAYHRIFAAQTEWILAEREARRIAVVLHEGDIVNVDDDAQWTVAARALHALDGKVPYVLAVGNHDLSYEGGRITRRCDRLNAYFPAAQVAGLGGESGTFEPGHIENRYQLIEAEGRRYLVLSLEYGPRDAVVAWADGVLSQYGGVPAFLLTHAYLARDGKRFQQQPFHPCGDAPNEFLDCNDGEMLWDKLVARHENVVFVFSGHELFPGVARLTSRRASGHRVHQLLANYQTCGGLPCLIPGTNEQTEGGDGFLRIVTVDPAARAAQVETYSPYLDARGRPAFRTDPDQRFTLALDAWQFRPPQPRAAVAFSPPERDDQPPSPLAVRPPLAVLPERRGCDGLQVVLRGVDAGGGPGSVRRVRACLDGACESFSVDEGLACRAARPQAGVSCVNDEGMLRLFFFSARAARSRVSVIARDAAGAAVFDGDDQLAAAPDRGCWSGSAALSDRRALRR
jgi:hypothetical protein